MAKQQMCRICLAQNVQMYVVLNKSLFDLYEKLTDTPFITADSRPILACYICCAQLKKCYRFQKKCLEAEEQFTKMMNEEYERKPLINQDQFELFHGFIRTPIDVISIVDVDQTENIVVKEELPAVCERRDDIIETNEEYETDIDIKPVNIFDNYLDIEVPPHNETDSQDDMPLIEFSTKEEQGSSNRKRKSYKTWKALSAAKKRTLQTGITKHADTTTEQKKTETEMIQDSLNQDIESDDDNDNNESMISIKSLEHYKRAYDKFIVWKNARNASHFSEDVFLAYFQELAEYKQPTTLWSVYSMLKSTVNTYNNIKMETFTRLLVYLKRQSQGYIAKKSKMFTSENIEEFLKDAPDDVYLLLKVVLIFGIYGACRTSELLKLTTDDVQIHSDDIIFVKLFDVKAKIDRSFIIRGMYKDFVEKYINLRPPDTKINRFFIRYDNGKCTRQVIGKNKFTSMPQEIASFLKIPDAKLYTGYCFRRTSACLLADSGVDKTILLRHGGWKSLRATGLIEESITKKARIFDGIFRNISLKEPSAGQ